MLDFSQVTNQIGVFTTEHAREVPRRRAALDEAAQRLRGASPVWEETRARIEASKTSWLVAELIEPPTLTLSPVARPVPHTVLAADGSQIVSDRHDVALCYLINVGMIALRYGTGERAYLTSRPVLAAPDDELLDESEGEQAAISPKRLSIRRLLAEFAALIELMEPCRSTSVSGAVPTLALLDGSLILWQLQTESDDFRAASLQTLHERLRAAREARIPVAGYVSLPNSRDVINALRVHRCPHPQANCDTYCRNRARPRPHYEAPDCVGTERVNDADLFATLLKPGERSALFGSSSPILNFYSNEDRVCFFYLHTGREIARIEIPEWVASDPYLLTMTHALCYDQACKGDGYPVALAEAHELAVIRNTERSAFLRLLERAFVTSRQPVVLTQKAVSKRARRV